MSRIQKLENIYKKPLENKNIKDTSNFIQNILNADVTKGKYARFLIEAFLNDKFLEEDLIGGLDSTLGQAISLFDKHKHKLPIEKRSVYALNSKTGEALYQSPGDLWNSVKQYQSAMSGKELRKEEQEQVYRETEFIYKDEVTGFQIVSPLTKESAQWWGKGTRWCTSAEKNNMFWTYAKDSPLLILLMPASASTAGNGAKLQLWKHKNRIQFMDEADNMISLNYIEKNWFILEPFIKWLNDLKYIPEKFKDYNFCLEAVKQNGLALHYIPEEQRDYSLCLEAIKQKGYALEFVPKKHQDYNLCLKVVKQYGLALQDIPKEIMDYNICLEAVKQNGLILEFVPDKLKDYNLCLEAIKQDGHALGCLPEEQRSYNICLEAIKQNGHALIYVPEELKDYDMCLKAIKKNGESLYYVPMELRTKELYELAVKQNGEALFYVPYQLKDELQHYVKNKVLELPIEKYKEIFYEIKTLFHKNDISLNIK